MFMEYLNIRNKPLFFSLFFFSFFILLSLFWSNGSCSTSSAGSDYCCSAGGTNLQPTANCATRNLPANGRRAAPRPVAAEAEGDHENNERRLERRELGGPGSSPPRCASKCGKCTPCKAVHVAVRPGTPVTAEYYPEAWRCKCGNKLYMP